MISESYITCAVQCHQFGTCTLGNYRFSEVLRRTVLLQHCSLLALTTAGELATIVQRSSAEGAATHALLPVTAQLLDWVVIVPDLLR